MKPRGIEIWKWLARKMMGLPSLPRLGLLGHLKMGPSGEDVPSKQTMSVILIGQRSLLLIPGGVSDWGDDPAPGGEPPPEPELLAPLYDDDPVGWELEWSDARVGWIMVPRPEPKPRP